MAIKSGYFKKHLAVDLSEGRCERLELSDEFIEQYIGGRGFGAKLVWDNLNQHNFHIDPLGPENMLVIAPGPLTGMYLPSSGKCSFVAISPATGIYGDSSAGGSFGIELRQAGLNLSGPMSADTAFNPERLAGVDAVLAMYHDQGLPVLKYMGFGRAVNITLGLPVIRTSVDHGTAFDIAWRGRASPNSLYQAIHLAVRLAQDATG